jgi:pimeloyl-ACP methyl ester carboxylesterase
VRRQGSFMVGGSVISNPGTFDPYNPTPAGQTFHGDHAYVEYQIPADARVLPLVMWHGAGQFSKTWETTPDGREGYQTVFLRRGFAVYIIDQPRRGNAGRSTVAVTINPTASEMSTFSSFRLGIWPNFFPNVQFSRDPAVLDQYFRQQTPNTGPEVVADSGIIESAVSALFDKIGPGVLLTHSFSGGHGWLTAIRTPNIKGIVSYEPGQFVFPADDMPPVVGTALPNIPVSPADFTKLTKIPIQIVLGDNIPTSPTGISGLDNWITFKARAYQFQEWLNRRGGDASVLSLPDIGIYGNTHFAFSDLNSLQIADLLSGFLHQKGLDSRED